MNTTPITCPLCGEEIHSGNCPHSRRDFVREIERLSLLRGKPMPECWQKDYTEALDEKDRQAAEIERLKAAIAEAIVLNNVLHGMYKVTQLLGNALEKIEAANE